MKVLILYAIVLSLSVHIANGQAKPTFSAIQNKREVLAEWLLSSEDDGKLYEYEGYDGWYNNPSRPDLGAVDTPLLRRVPAAYEDGVYKPSGGDRPNPLDLSRELLSGDPGTMSKTGKTALLVFFGQQVVEEILDAQRAACPPEYFNVPIPEGHEYRTKPGHTEMPVLRTRFDASTGFSPNNPRQQLNEITPYLDGGLVYGTSRAWADQLRTYANGTIDPKGLLATSHDGLFPEYNTIRLPMANPPPPTLHHEFITKHQLLPVSRFFKLGNPRGNENTFLLTFGILWFRWHNYLARTLARLHPDWAGEKVYNEARKWTIATQQHIVVNEWLPSWLGKSLPKYERYDPSIDPQIDQFFQAAAFRFGHTLVPPGVYLRDYARNGCEYNIESWGRKSVRTCNSFWRPQDAIKTNISDTELVDIDRLLMGMAFQASEREDNVIVEDLRGRVFGPLEFSRRDLMALNIQRGRDHGLPDFNTARKAYNLPDIDNVNHFSRVADNIRTKLMQLYNGNLNNIDIWVGGILETGDGPGEFFRTVIEDQFRRIRDGDRFWYRNQANGLFNSDEIERLERLILSDIIMAVTKMDADDIQPNVFQVPLQNDYDQLNVACQMKLTENRTCRRTEPITTQYTCYHLPQLNQERLNETCTESETYDYFSNSEVSFIFTFVGLTTFIIGIATLIKILLILRNKAIMETAENRNKNVRDSMKLDKDAPHPYTALEWINNRVPHRNVAVFIDAKKRKIEVKCQNGNLLRAINFNNINTTISDGKPVTIYKTHTNNYIIMRISNHYDLVLKFVGDVFRDRFISELKSFLENLGLFENNTVVDIDYKAVLKHAISQDIRQKQLERFFRVAFAQALDNTKAIDDSEKLNIGSKQAKEVIDTELTIYEFAEALSMRADSEFVQKIFKLSDKDENGFVSFREFLNLITIFREGTADQKLELLFDMYDIDAKNILEKDDFKNMLKSFMNIVKAQADDMALDQVVEKMLEAAHLNHKEKLTKEDFKKLLAHDKAKLEKADIDFKGAAAVKASIANIRSSMNEIYAGHEELEARVAGKVTNSKSPTIDEKNIVMTHSTSEQKKTTKWSYVTNYVESNSLEIFWKALYTLVLLAIFAERAYYYTVEREHSGLRRIAGLGVTVTRGAASAMMFTYSTLLLTMCRNTITKLRETVLHMYIPFDRAVEMHKFIAKWALIFTVMHIIGHAFNFYHISTQTSDDLTCLFRNYFHATHEIPKFHYWCWQTITGVTGIALTMVTAVMYIFTLGFVREKLYKWFWLTHSMYPIFFILMILHGAGRLIQAPFFHYFFLGPVILFAIDMALTGTRRKLEIQIDRAVLLPSEVTLLQFRKPENFSYKSGQWVRIACTELNRNEFHPFTLSSSPNEEHLSVHIRAVGPWTMNIRQIYDNTVLKNGPLSSIRLDGPYGEAHQDWYKYDVAILVGGGIGVTPFASILKDILYKSNLRTRNMPQKVYFLWVTKTQRQFEWLVDIIRDLENNDELGTVSVHLFITQFYKKFDLRTILLYICELHFQKLSGRSLFTGLKAVTHFGRPNFFNFFSSIQTIHSSAKTIGVFTCGPPNMTRNVENASRKINELNNGPSFSHNYTNF